MEKVMFFMERFQINMLDKKSEFSDICVENDDLTV
jgi:hypothetical protein